MKAIGFVTRYPPTHCGIAEYSKFLISALKFLNPNLRVVVFTTNESFENTYYDSDIKVIPCFSRFERDYSNLIDALANEKVEVLHLQHEYGIFGTNKKIINVINEAKEERLIKSGVITMHTVHHPYTLLKEALEFQRELNKLDAVIVHSDLQEFELIVQGIDAAKIHSISHGTLINPYLGYSKKYLAKSLRISNPKGFVCAIPGFMRRDKGVDTLLEALDGLENLKLTLIFAGEPQDDVVRELVESYKSKTILIERYLSSDEILKVVALADAVILPYKDKLGSYAVSGILHLSMGGLKPIVGSRVPRLVELCQHSPWLTVPSSNAKELANKIKWLISNYEFTVSYMHELYAYAAETQWVNIAHEHYKLYNWLLNKSKNLYF